ncbi:peptidoglycan editing factor PgeF [Mangrovibrevibacter kandeliae]|uniref:peptidoglycan editing factor PgeF n=1 Tax=Mangrovibrevibacter kandeliae TaxID=2968473 RepID=UPI002118D676|nr:peptidoglycan editing factor PgeF [Aurantimonas sp. CSK15Z-1]MCQ8781026.1 peptidoglycan editing factor PgeF [Aurantimonas sp. CSK15Z-1]
MSDPSPTPYPSLTEADVVTADALAFPGIRHGFFTRRGGISTGLYAGLNTGIGSQDEPDAVAENRHRALAFLGSDAERLATPWQVHSAEAIAVTEPFAAGARPKVDAVVTATPGLAVGVVTADCGPVLFADPEARVIGAAHAGWRGATGGVLEATLDAMVSLGASRSGITAILGPTITQPNYEVGADMAERIGAAEPEAARFFAPGHASDKRQFDLPGYIVARLGRSGVAAGFVGACTYANEGHFYSYRRTTHRSEPDYGRQLSAIILES